MKELELLCRALRRKQVGSGTLDYILSFLAKAITGNVDGCNKREIVNTGGVIGNTLCGFNYRFSLHAVAYTARAQLLLCSARALKRFSIADLSLF